MEVLQTDKAPKPIGSYSQAIKVGRTLYLSGQIPLVTETMELCDGDFKAQVKQAFKNVYEVCGSAGGDLNSIVKLTVYLLDLKKSPLVNEVMNELFTLHKPARVMLEVSALPMGAEVEVDAMAVISDN